MDYHEQNDTNWNIKTKAARIRDGPGIYKHPMCFRKNKLVRAGLHIQGRL